MLILSLTLVEFYITNKFNYSNLVIIILYYGLVWFTNYMQKNHKCNFNIRKTNTKINENTRDLTYGCECGKTNTINVNKDSVKYKKFIYERRN